MKTAKILFLLLTVSAAHGQTKTGLTTETKLFGLSKLWSEVKYNFANFDLTKINWDSTYKAFIPKVMATNTEEAYFKELMQMMALLKDGHSNVYYKPFFAYKKPPIKTKLIEGKVIITEIYNDTLLTVNKLEVGDEILEVNKMIPKIHWPCAPLWTKYLRVGKIITTNATNQSVPYKIR